LLTRFFLSTFWNPTNKEKGAYYFQPVHGGCAPPKRPNPPYLPLAMTEAPTTEEREATTRAQLRGAC
jgi:hypothetical protein